MVFEVADEHQVADTLQLIKPALESTMDELETLYSRTDDLVGAPTGYTDLDQLLFRPTRLQSHYLGSPAFARKDCFCFGGGETRGHQHSKASFILFYGDGLFGVNQAVVVL